MSSFRIYPGDTLKVETNDTYLYKGIGIFVKQEPHRIVHTRLYLTADSAVRCWTSDWSRTQEEVEMGNDFQCWLEEKAKSRIVKAPKRV